MCPPDGHYVAGTTSTLTEALTSGCRWMVTSWVPTLRIGSGRWIRFRSTSTPAVCWMASATSFVPWNPTRTGFDIDKQKWELYHVDEDFSQANDRAAANPQKLRYVASVLGVDA